MWIYELEFQLPGFWTVVVTQDNNPFRSDVLFKLGKFPTLNFFKKIAQIYNSVYKNEETKDKRVVMTRISRLTMYECTGLQIVENFISWWNVDTEINSKPGRCYLI
jgi:hypothetical protein